MKVALPNGGGGEATSFDGELLVAVLDRAFAPGAPCELRIVTDAPPPLVLGAKAIGSKKRDDGRFEVRMRLLTLGRQDRERLRAALDPALR